MSTTGSTSPTTATSAAGEDKTQNDFGNFELATTAGTKFEDVDGDGTRDQGEPGLSGG